MIGLRNLASDLQTMVLMASYGRALGPRGKIFYVDSTATGASASGPATKATSPSSTLARAIALCTASRGDVIIVAPGHVENIATAAAIDVNVAGVTVIGIGSGGSRPTFTFTGTTATFAISAASAYVANIRVTSGVAELVKMFHVTAADATIDGVAFLDAGATFTTIQFLLTDTNANRLTVKNCDGWKGTAAAATEIWMELVGSDGCTIENNRWRLTCRNNAGVRTLATTGTACLGLIVNGNIFDQRGGTTQDLVVSMVAATTGIYSNNRTFGDVGTLAASIALADMAGSESYQGSTVNKSGILDPVVA